MTKPMKPMEVLQVHWPRAHDLQRFYCGIDGGLMLLHTDVAHTVTQNPRIRRSCGCCCYYVARTAGAHHAQLSGVAAAAGPGPARSRAPAPAAARWPACPAPPAALWPPAVKLPAGQQAARWWCEMHRSMAQQAGGDAEPGQPSLDRNALKETTKPVHSVGSTLKLGLIKCIGWQRRNGPTRNQDGQTGVINHDMSHGIVNM